MARPRQISPKFANTSVRAPLELSEWQTLTHTERAAGKPDRLPDVPRPFLLQLRKASSVGTGLAKFRRPDWIARIAKANEKPAQALDTLAERTMKTPNEASLREAQMILNDLGRLPGGGKLVRSKLTQRVVDGLIGKGA